MSNIFYRYRFSLIFSSALLLSIFFPSNSLKPVPWGIISDFLGWSYFISWSTAFYFQLHLNYSRNSAVGLSFDFLILNLFGFFSYSVYNSAFYYSASIQKHYRDYYNTENRLISFADVIFSWHAFSATSLTIIQISVFRYERESVTFFGKIFSIGFVVVGGFVFLTQDILLFLELLGIIKVAVTIIKYTPQIYLIYKQKSTLGWSIDNRWMDFTGGLMSLLQLTVDSIAVNHIEGITENPIKLGLGFLSLGFDFCFFAQHYVFYRDKWDQKVIHDENLILKKRKGGEYEKLRELDSNESIDSEKN